MRERASLPSLALLLSFAWLASGCTVPVKPPEVMRVAMFDETGEFSPTDWQRRFLLVTVTATAYAGLIATPPTDGEQLPVEYARFLEQLRARHALERVADWPLRTLGIRCLVFEQRGSQPTATIIKSLEADPRVETAQVMESFEVLQSAASYSDPYLDLQQAYSLMDVADAHRYATGKGVRVAVIDTGVDVEHLDIASAIDVSRNHVDADEAGFRRDVHGTAVAAIIGARRDDAIGIAGVAPEASLLALKACWPERLGDRGAKCNSYTVAKALNVAIAQQVDIINLSLGGPPDALLERLVRKAQESGAIVVAALHPTTPGGFAAGIDGVIVARDLGNNALPETLAVRTVGAPGANVLSARPGNQYDFFDGSSLSAAHVSGTVALMRERRPHLTSQAALAALRRHGGPGPVSACASLVSLIAGGECPRDPAHD